MSWLAERFELSRGGAADNLRPMEGLRGFAVVLVFLVHYTTSLRPWLVNDPALLSFAVDLHSMGNTGVDLFFVLSGFLIYGSLIQRPQPFWGFMARRMARIYPTFIAVFALYLLLSYLLPSASKIPLPLSSALLYLLKNLMLLPGIFPSEPMISVAWSLSFEVFFYLVTPMLITALRLRGRTWRWRVGFFLGLTTAFLVYAVNDSIHLVRLIMFVSGILLHELLCHGRRLVPSGLSGLLALALGLAGMLMPISGNLGVVIKVGILFCAFLWLCLACFRNPVGWLSRLFSWAPLRWLGNMSYSYYLLHGLVLKAAFIAIGWLLPPSQVGAWVFWLLLPVSFIATLGPTALLFLWIERPFSLARKPKPRQSMVERAPS